MKATTKYFFSMNSSTSCIDSLSKLKKVHILRTGKIYLSLTNLFFKDIPSCFCFFASCGDHHFLNITARNK